MATDNAMRLTISALDEFSGTIAKLQGDLAKVRKETDGLTPSTDKSKASFSGFLGTISSFQGALAAIGIGVFAKEIISAGMAMDKLTNSMQAATGSLDGLNFVRAESQRLGLDLLTTAESYTKLAAAARGTRLEGSGAQEVFTAVSEAANVLGLSSEQTSRSLTALQQMLSKGTVQAEELRGQLEPIPGAFQIAARAMGVTTAELDKMLKDGKVIADDFLPKFAAELQKTFPANEQSMHSMTSEVNRLKTAFFDLKGEVFKGTESIWKGMAVGLTELTQDLTRLVGELREGAALISSIRKGGGSLWDALNYRPDENLTTPLGSGEKLIGMVAAGRRAAGLLAPASARMVKGGNGLSEADKLWIEMAGSRVSEWVEQEKLNDEMWISAIQERIDAWVSRQDTEFSDIINGDAFLNATGKLSPGQQKQFDQSARQSEWEAARRTQQERDLELEREFMAERARLAGEETAMELLRIDQEEQRWLQSWAMQTSSFEEFERRKIQIAEFSAEKRKQVEQKAELKKLELLNQGFSAFVNVTNAIYTATGKNSKELFYINKAAGIAQGLISMYTAVVRTMAETPGPPPVKFAAAAAMAAAAGAQVAGIVATSFEGGGSASAGGFGGGTMTSPVVTQPVTPPVPDQGNITIVLKGVPTGKWIEEELVPELNAAGTRNVRIEYVN